jgi:hypothetical protein
MKRFAATPPVRFEMLLDKSHVTAFSAVNEVCDAIAAFLEEVDNGQVTLCWHRGRSRGFQ